VVAKVGIVENGKDVEAEANTSMITCSIRKMITVGVGLETEVEKVRCGSVDSRLAPTRVVVVVVVVVIVVVVGAAVVIVVV